VVRREMQPIEASLLGSLDLVGLLRECQDQLSREYPEANVKGGGMENSTMGSAEALGGRGFSQHMGDTLQNTDDGGDQHLQSDFFETVLQLPPTQGQGLSELGFSSFDTESLGFCTQTSSNTFSDSGYASGRFCNCKDACTCVGTMSGYDSQYVDISSPSLVSPPEEPERLEEYIQYEMEPENQDWVHEQYGV
jgi:hypothetical protein